MFRYGCELKLKQLVMLKICQLTAGIILILVHEMSENCKNGQIFPQSPCFLEKSSCAKQSDRLTQSVILTFKMELQQVICMESDMFSPIQSHNIFISGGLS